MISIPNLLLYIVLFTGIALILDKFILYQDPSTEEKQINNIYSNFLKKNIRFFASFFYVFLLVFIVRSFLFEPFYIPSTSMNPTLLEGDFIIVKKYSYGIRNPITNSIILSIDTPIRGDIAVFKYPKNHNINFVKRIVGISGDYIKYNVKKKQLTIYSKNKKNIYSKIQINYSDLKNYQSEKINISSNQTNTSSHNFQMQQKILNDICNIEESNETIDHYSHKILLNRLLRDDVKLYYKQDKITEGEWIVPKNSYFVMGDSRDNSLDSRYWGFLSDEDLIGKASMIWMSIEKTKNIWPIQFRFNRIGLIN